MASAGISCSVMLMFEASVAESKFHVRDVTLQQTLQG